MDLDQLLARSQAPGSFVERKTFTLSRDKALAKMRDFTFRNRSQFVLELVQASGFANARWMFVDSTPVSCTVGWIGGKTLTRTQLEGLFDYLFVAEGASENRHLRQIAVAANVLLRSKPVTLRIESGDGTTAARLDLDKDGNGTVGVPAEAMDGTYLHVQFAEKGWFTKSRLLDDPRIMLVETECTYSKVPIFANGSGPLGWDRYVPLTGTMTRRDQVTFDADGRDGWMGLAPPREKHWHGKFHLVVGGVKVSRRAIPELGDHERLCGVIRDDQLAKTADMADVVADHRYLAMLHALQPMLRDFAARREFVLPELEPLEEVPAEGEAVTTPPLKEVGPITEGVQGLVDGLRWSLDELRQVRSQPLYWVAPEDVADVLERLSPPGFPGRVAVLSPQAVVELTSQLDLRPHRVRPEDADFVREQALKAYSQPGVSVEVPVGVCSLRYDPNHPVGWGSPFGVSVLLIQRGAVVRTLSIPWPGDGLSAVLELDGDADLPSDDEVVSSVEQGLWELALSVAQPELTRALLNESAYLQPDEEGVVRVQLPADGASADGLLDLPLVEDGPSARQMLSLLGTPRSIEVPDPERFAVLSEFMARFGAGHLALAGAKADYVVTLWHTAGRWVPERAQGSDAFVGIRQWFGQPVLDGFEAVDTPHPILVGAAAPTSTVDFEAGFQALADRSRHWVAVGQPLRDDPLRLAMWALAPDHGVDERSSLKAIQDGVEAVSLRGGASEDVPGTRLSVDEAMAFGAKVRWRMDDPPSLWMTFPSSKDFLEVVEIDGMQGWIGLRHPYDPTAGILVKRGWTTRLLSMDRLPIRVHGWCRPGREQSVEEPLIGAWRTLLVQLAGRGADEDEARAATRRAYCGDFALLARLHPASAIDSTLAAMLGDRVEAGDGTLRQWLELPTSARPPLNQTLRGLDGSVMDPAFDAPVGQEALGLLDVLKVGLVRFGLGTVSLGIHPDGWTVECSETGNGTLNIRLGGRSSTTRNAQKHHRRAATILFLDVATKLYAYGAPRDLLPGGFLSLQRCLLGAIDDLIEES